MHAGARGSDHCNAHADHSRYCSMREAAQSMASPHTPAQPAGSSRPAQPTRSTGAHTAVAALRGFTTQRGRRGGSIERAPSRLSAGRMPSQTPALQAALLASARAIADSSFEEESLVEARLLPRMRDRGPLLHAESLDAFADLDMLADLDGTSARASAHGHAGPSSAAANRSRQPRTAPAHSPSAARTADAMPLRVRDGTDARALAHAPAVLSSSAADRTRQPRGAAAHSTPAARTAAASLSTARVATDVRAPAHAASSPSPVRRVAAVTQRLSTPAPAASALPRVAAHTAAASVTDISRAAAGSAQVRSPCRDLH